MVVREILRDRERLAKLFVVLFWISMVILAIGYYFIIKDLLG